MNGRTKLTDEEYLLFEELITGAFGLSFPDHKREILETRLHRRLEALKLRTFFDYYLLLQYNPDGELRFLATAITNNETYFFREVDQFHALFDHAVPELASKRATAGPFRFLSAGCSSGEEVYTMNIFARSDPKKTAGCGAEIRGFDIDVSRIEMAEAAVYSKLSFRATAESDLARYFDGRPDAGCRPKPDFREGVAFSPGNILKIDSFPKPLDYDAVFCRNVLIYFSEAALVKAIENFARALRPGGILFIGHSESIIGRSESFETVRVGDCIAYRRVGA